MKPRLRLAIVPGPRSGTIVRDELSQLDGDADPVVLEQIAVLVGALTSGSETPPARSPAPLDLKLWVRGPVVRVQLRDREFARHRSKGGLVDLDRSLVSGWRLKMVERLADRWAVENDGALTLSFEFDGERSVREEPDDGHGALWLEDHFHPPIGGWGIIPANRRSRDGGTRRVPGHFPSDA
jgi:hypothetical protein